MSRSLVNPSDLKRKRPETGLPDTEQTILNLIKSKKDIGIWVRDIKQETKIAGTVVDKSLKSLLAKNLIKDVVNFQNKGKKHYMAVEFEPSKEISGGDWYTDGKLDTQLISILKQLCLLYMRKQKVATLDGVHNHLKKSPALTFEISKEQASEIVNSMVLDNDIIEVKSTGLGDYHLIPLGTTCYRVAREAGVAKGPRVGAFASTPCGACPRIILCTPDGVISPATCVYYTKCSKFCRLKEMIQLGVPIADAPPEDEGAAGTSKDPKTEPIPVELPDVIERLLTEQVVSINRTRPSLISSMRVITLSHISGHSGLEGLYV